MSNVSYQLSHVHVAFIISCHSHTKSIKNVLLMPSLTSEKLTAYSSLPIRKKSLGHQLKGQCSQNTKDTPSGFHLVWIVKFRPLHHHNRSDIHLKCYTGRPGIKVSSEGDL